MCPARKRKLSHHLETNAALFLISPRPQTADANCIRHPTIRVRKFKIIVDGNKPRARSWTNNTKMELEGYSRKFSRDEIYEEAAARTC